MQAIKEILRKDAGFIQVPNRDMKGDEGAQNASIKAIFPMMGKKRLPEVLVAQGAIQIDKCDSITEQLRLINRSTHFCFVLTLQRIAIKHQMAC